MLGLHCCQAGECHLKPPPESPPDPPSGVDWVARPLMLLLLMDQQQDPAQAFCRFCFVPFFHFPFSIRTRFSRPHRPSFFTHFCFGFCASLLFCFVFVFFRSFAMRLSAALSPYMGIPPENIYIYGRYMPTCRLYIDWEYVYISRGKLQCLQHAAFVCRRRVAGNCSLYSTTSRGKLRQKSPPLPYLFLFFCLDSWWSDWWAVDFISEEVLRWKDKQDTSGCY